jgi:hypothetical protein
MACGWRRNLDSALRVCGAPRTNTSSPSFQFSTSHWSRSGSMLGCSEDAAGQFLLVARAQSGIVEDQLLQTMLAMPAANARSPRTFVLSRIVFQVPSR